MRLTCGVLGFSRQAYYAWLAAPVSSRDLEDAYLINALIDAHGDDPELRLGEDGRVTTPAMSDDVRVEARPTMLYLIKQLELAARAALDEALRPVSITPGQYTALTVLERRADLSTAEMARNSFTTDQSAADVIGALEERGLISRAADPVDRRRRVIRLTDAGRELLARVQSDVAAVETRMLSPLTAEAAEDLRRSLIRCRGALSGGSPH